MLYCQNYKETAIIIEEQPFPQLFYRPYLELDLTNLVSILSFDSRSMKALINDEQCKKFDKQFPIFFKLNNAERNRR